ncbi:MAG: hypothetical protein A2014_03715 [Spirochaetes bacterium GWF1_49_6]|nr:MAG: hypothetical protein A2014_03715 [Spirochaetes bacterium GWF1_49_6]
MKLRVLAVLILIISALTMSSCFNVFSLLNPAEPAQVDSIPMLLSMGDGYLSEGEYENAYNSYARVLDLEPNNALGLEGICTAYIYWKIPPVQLIRAIISNDYSIIDMNKLYDVSWFVHDKLYQIVSSAGDGSIPYDDVNINLNFFIFNTAYAAFTLGDTDMDKNIIMDTNDYMIFYPDFSISNNLPNTTNFIAAIKMLNTIATIVPQFNILIAHSEYSLAIIESSVYSDSVKAEISNVRASIDGMKQTVLSNFETISNLTSLEQFGITNNFDLTNTWLFEGFTPTNYTEFTNAMAQAGITNLADMQTELSVLLPDLTNFNLILSNYFGL